MLTVLAPSRYSNLKKAIYNLEQDLPAGVTGQSNVGDDIEQESSALLGASISDADGTFIPLLDKELRKIVVFYGMMEADLREELDQLRLDLRKTESEEVFDEEDDGDSDGDESDIGEGPGATDPNPTTNKSTQKSRKRMESMDDVFHDPHKYNEASREERELRGWSSRPKGPGRKTSRMGAQSGTEEGTSAAEGREQGADAASPSRRRRLSQSIADEEGLAMRPRMGSNPPRPLARRLSNMFKRKPMPQRKTLGLVAPGADNGGPPGSPMEGDNRRIGDSDAGASSGFFDDKSMSIWTAENDWAVDMRITFKKRITNLFVTMSELRQFVQLNETGMKKILKKYDKIMKSDLKSRYMDEVLHQQYPFKAETTNQLDCDISELTTYYAKVVTAGDVMTASAQLKTHLREQVVWQRNTVWREMIGIERRAQGATLEAAVMGGASQQGMEKPKPTRLRTPCGVFTLPSWIGISTVQLFVAFSMLVLLLKAPGLRFFNRVEEQNCLAMLVFCTILWATEVIPLFVTSLMVPLLVVVLQVARTDDIEDRRMNASETTKWIFSQMFAPNMALLLGGFTLAAALSKYGIDKLLAQKVLRFAGSRPPIVLLAHMGVACFASMWISNVAAPVLMYSLIQPILRNLPSRSPFASSLIMGIALASNIGGQTSPIASPQNLIALQYMDEPLGWLQWFAITIPVSGLSLVVIWLLLLWSYGSSKGTVIRKMNESNDRFTPIQYFISAVALGTISLWCLERNFEYVLGDMGVIAIIPMVLFFGTGILTKEDFNNFLWTIVFLAMGGIALGKAVTSSGLLASLDDLIQSLVVGMPIWKVLLSLLSISLVVATFIVSLTSVSALPVCS